MNGIQLRDNILFRKMAENMFDLHEHLGLCTTALENYASDVFLCECGAVFLFYKHDLKYPVRVRRGDVCCLNRRDIDSLRERYDHAVLERANALYHFTVLETSEETKL